jgi:hypothetical protein
MQIARLCLFVVNEKMRPPSIWRGFGTDKAPVPGQRFHSRLRTRKRSCISSCVRKPQNWRRTALQTSRRHVAGGPDSGQRLSAAPYYQINRIYPTESVRHSVWLIQGAGLRVWPRPLRTALPSVPATWMTPSLGRALLSRPLVEDKDRPAPR